MTSAANGSFQSTLPARGATYHVFAKLQIEPISIHAPREGSDPLFPSAFLLIQPFQSTLPARGATSTETTCGLGVIFQSTLPARGATSDSSGISRRSLFQSTLPARGATYPSPPSRSSPRNFNPRSPRGERPLRKASTSRQSISIHAPREGSDFSCTPEFAFRLKFQSTLPARGATLNINDDGGSSGNFNPRSPRGERRLTNWQCITSTTFQSTLPARGATRRWMDLIGLPVISIHAPREGSDTPFPFCLSPHSAISIHAPREGSDSNGAGVYISGSHFNPRSPRGERQHHPDREGFRKKFQSTLPARGATTPVDGRGENTVISIHAPREGSDLDFVDELISPRQFQSTLPARGATWDKVTKHVN